MVPTFGLKLVVLMFLPTVTQPGRMLWSSPNSSSRRLQTFMPCTHGHSSRHGVNVPDHAMKSHLHKDYLPQLLPGHT
jgi:hypothetical protein